MLKALPHNDFCRRLIHERRRQKDRGEKTLFTATILAWTMGLSEKCGTATGACITCSVDQKALFVCDRLRQLRIFTSSNLLQTPLADGFKTSRASISSTNNTRLDSPGLDYASIDPRRAVGKGEQHDDSHTHCGSLGCCSCTSG